jgi:hypothetical protein
MIIVGTLMVIKTEWLMQNFGRIEWFEKQFGPEGGSRLGYKIMAMVVIFFGLLIMTGLINGFMNWLVSPLIRK